MFEKHYTRWFGMATNIYLNISKWYENAIISTKGLKKDQLQAEKLAYVLNLGGLEKKTLRGDDDYLLAKSLLQDYSDQGSDELKWLIINEISPESVFRFPNVADQYELFTILGE